MGASCFKTFLCTGSSVQADVKAPGLFFVSSGVSEAACLVLCLLLYAVMYVRLVLSVILFITGL